MTGVEGKKISRVIIRNIHGYTSVHEVTDAISSELEITKDECITGEL